MPQLWSTERLSNGYLSADRLLQSEYNT